jgi:hypothetical protein
LSISWFHDHDVSSRRPTSGTVNTRQATKDTDRTQEPTGSTTDNARGGSRRESGGRGTGGASVRDSAGSNAVSGESKRPARYRANTDGKRPPDRNVPAGRESGARNQKPNSPGQVRGSELLRPIDKSDSGLSPGFEFRVHYQPGRPG